MANKITEIITEPNKIYIGSTFKLKIKAIRYITCNEAKTKTCNYMKQFTCNEVKGIWKQ